MGPSPLLASRIVLCLVPGTDRGRQVLVEENFSQPTRPRILKFPITIWRGIKCRRWGVEVGWQVYKPLGTLPPKYRVGQGTVIGKRSKVGKELKNEGDD